MSPEECEMAARGDLSDARTQAAVGKLWQSFQQHAAEVHGEGRRKAVQKNAREHPSAAAANLDPLSFTPEKSPLPYVDSGNRPSTSTQAQCRSPMAAGHHR